MTSGLCLALSMLTALAVLSHGSLQYSRSLTSNNSAKGNNPSNSSVTEISVTEPYEIGFDNSDEMKKAYKAYKKKISSKNNNDTSLPDDTQSTTPITSSLGDENTTITTTVTSQTSQPTTAASETDDEHSESVSNGMQPFNYNDVSSIADDINTFGDFVDKLTPSLISWDGSEYNDNGCVRVILESVHGIVVLDVKPISGALSDDEQIGSISGNKITDWNWLEENRNAGCNISSVTWIDASFGIDPVRGIEIGSTLAKLTDTFLCVNGGATTLYRASDVIEDQNKLNSILAAENLYTFVGGRVYSIGSFLDKYYNGKEHTFRFEDCDYVVQYGCNSIIEHNYTTGSWIIEYAVKEDVVIGISFMNKSYYKNEQKTAISTNISSSGSESTIIITTHAESSETNDEISEEPEGNHSGEADKDTVSDVTESDTESVISDSETADE